jgi:hypothetical protein
MAPVETAARGRIPETSSVPVATSEWGDEMVWYGAAAADIGRRRRMEWRREEAENRATVGVHRLMKDANREMGLQKILFP